MRVLSCCHLLCKNCLPLTALDLSCNNFKLALNHQVCDLLADTLGSMTALRRLDLSNNRLKGHLHCLFSKLNGPMEMLRLCACGLNTDDITYLTHANHCRFVLELDLSENYFGGNGQQLATLLLSVSQRLAIVELEDCDFTAADIMTLCDILPQLTNLYYINLSRNNDFTRVVFFDVMKCLLFAPSLKLLRASYPVDCYISVNEEEIDVERRHFVSSLMQHGRSFFSDSELIGALPTFIFSF